MQCHACGTALEPHAFPGAVVRCACGADNVVPPPEAAPAAPYRQPAPAAEPAVGPAPALPHDLGPLCPRCTRLLRDDEERSGMACDRCGGILVDHAVLSARVQAERPAGPRDAAPAVGSSRHAHRTPPAASSYARCPECGEVMARMNFGRHSGVLLDVCRAHGTWFDGGELDAALAFVRAGGLEGEPPPPSPAATEDPSTRAAMATLAMQAAFEEHRVEEDANDLAYFLLTGSHRPGYWARWRARAR